MNSIVVSTISLLLIAGCDGAGRSRQKSEAVGTSGNDSIALSSEARVQSVPIPEEAQGAVSFRLTVSRVHNPGRVPVQLATTLIASGDTITVGSVALYPADSGGVFAVSLPQLARSAISRSVRAREAARMLIRLSGSSDDVTLMVRIGGWER